MDCSTCSYHSSDGSESIDDIDTSDWRCGLSLTLLNQHMVKKNVKVRKWNWVLLIVLHPERKTLIGMDNVFSLILIM